jgi:hypothetical protein
MVKAWRLKKEFSVRKMQQLRNEYPIWIDNYPEIKYDFLRLNQKLFCQLRYHCDHI